MNAPQILPLAFLILVLAALLGTCALIHARHTQRLRERVRIQNAAPVCLIPPSALPSIQIGREQPGRLTGRIFAWLHFTPEVPATQIIPWPFVVTIGLLVGGFAFLRVADLAGTVAAAPAGVAAGVVAMRAVFGWQHRRYCQAVFRQIPESLGLMVRAIRAGLPLAEALRSVAREVPSPTRDEFSRVVGDMAIGRSVDAALMRLHERTGLSEYAFLAVTLGLQSQTGGSLAETLDNLAEVVRKRVAMAKRAEALAGEAKMQAGLLVVLPFIAGLAMSFSQPFYISAFTENPTGQKMLMFGLGLMALGVLTIRWLIRKAGED